MNKMKNKDAEKYNPCLKEQELTYKCYDKNSYDKEKCQLEIENYRTCKSFWNSVQSDRRRRGISPYLPPVEEREEVKKQYFRSLQQSHNDEGHT